MEQYNSLASMDSNVIDKMASEISKELDIPQELIANAMERHQPTEMKDEETISTDRYYSPIWDFINDVYKDITESNNNESLKESDLTRIVKRVIMEDNKQTTKVGDSDNLKNLKTYLKELVDESVIDNDVKVHIMFLVKKLIEENKK